MFMCSWQQGEANFFFGVSQYSVTNLIRIVQIYTEWRSLLWCLHFHLRGERAGHASVTQQFEFTGSCEPGLEDREEGKQKKWKDEVVERGNVSEWLTWVSQGFSHEHDLLGAVLRQPSLAGLVEHIHLMKTATKMSLSWTLNALKSDSKGINISIHIYK